MTNKLDMGRAWNEAIALVSGNRDVLWIVAGVFFFLPNVAFSLLFPVSEDVAVQAQALAAEQRVDELIALYSGVLADTWWIILLSFLFQAVGMLGLLALLTDKSRPTVGQALAFGAKALVPYLLAQVLMGLIFGAVFVILVGTGALVGAALAVVMVLVFLVVAIYLSVKFSLVSPVIAIEQEMNPVNALLRSWRLTKGNSFRLFFFFALLFIVLLVISMVLGLVLAIPGMLGEEVALIVGGILGGLFNMAVITVLLAVLAAVHRQLAGHSPGSIKETFE